MGVRRNQKGLTLIEVLIAMFIFAVGIIGVLAAIPSGISTATWVIFQDAAIHLAHSKFSEFRRDRVDPGNGPQPNLTPASGGYLPTSGPYVSGGQEPPNTSPIGSDNIQWRDFAHAPGDPYQYFDDIQKYEWKVQVTDVENGTGDPGGVQAPPGYYFPADSASTSSINLKRVSITIRIKGSMREMRFSQLMFVYGQL